MEKQVVEASQQVESPSWFPAFDSTLRGMDGILASEAIAWNEATAEALRTAAETAEEPIVGAVRKQPERDLTRSRLYSLVVESAFLVLWSAVAAFSVYGIVLIGPERLVAEFHEDWFETMLIIAVTLAGGFMAIGFAQVAVLRLRTGRSILLAQDAHAYATGVFAWGKTHVHSIGKDGSVHTVSKTDLARLAIRRHKGAVDIIARHLPTGKRFIARSLSPEDADRLRSAIAGDPAA